MKYHHNLVWDKHFKGEGRAQFNDDDDNDTNILIEAIEAPNDSDYHEFWSQIQILQLVILLGYKS